MRVERKHPDDDTPPKGKEKKVENTDPPTYDDTKVLFDKWERIRDKYWPKSDLYSKNNTFQEICELFQLEEFDQQEKLEEKKKFNFYTNRQKMGVFDVVALAQFRLSLMNIFGLFDDILVDEIKTDKVYNQIHIVKDQVEK